MRCSSCGYIYDPTLKPTEIYYDESYFSQVGGIPFITSPNLADVFACPVCGSLMIDVSATPEGQAAAAGLAGTAGGEAAAPPAGA